MKKSISFLILMLPVLLWGQVVNHFDNSDSRWHVAKTFSAANLQNPSFAATTTTVYGFQGDTLINSEQWFKLYSTNDSLFQTNLVYQGLTRTENNRILYLNPSNQLDTLYDFNLNVGDSVLYYLYGEYPEWISIINIDSVLLNETFYKRFTFSEPSINGFEELDEVWIEGIGSIHGPLFPDFPIKFSQEIPDSMLLVCSFSDEQHIWKHHSYSDCYVNIVLGIGIIEPLNFKVYPNPFSGTINLENANNEIVNVTILNSLGQVIRQVKITSTNATIDLSELNDGLYFVKIDDGKNSTMAVKIIKQN